MQTIEYGIGNYILRYRDSQNNIILERFDSDEERFAAWIKLRKTNIDADFFSAKLLGLDED